MNEKVEISELLNDTEFKILPIIAARALSANKTENNNVYINVTDLMEDLREYQKLNETYNQGVEQLDIQSE